MSCASLHSSSYYPVLSVKPSNEMLWIDPAEPYIFCSSIHLAALSGGSLIERGEDIHATGAFPRIPSREPRCQESVISGTSRNKRNQTIAETQTSAVPRFQSVIDRGESNLKNMVCGRVPEARHMNRNESATLLFAGEFSNFTSDGSVRSGCGSEACDCIRLTKTGGVGDVHHFPSRMSQKSVDLLYLWKVYQDLRTSGWYYEGLSMQESVQMLSSQEVGTFLVRDSSDSRYLFSLSFRTNRGPTSVRIHFKVGLFSLDSDTVAKPDVPSFSSIQELVSFYTEGANRNKNNGQVWLDGQGQVFGNIMLKRPLLKIVPSLRHLSRLSWNKLVLKQQVELSGRTEGIPPVIMNYLNSYPYAL